MSANVSINEKEELVTTAEAEAEAKKNFSTERWCRRFSTVVA